MSLVFQQGSTLILTDGNTSRELLVSSVSISQTFLEEERQVKTLHTLNQVADTFTNSKSAASIEFSFHLTAGDELLLDWFGFSKSGSRFNLPVVVGAQPPSNFNLYLKTLTSWYRVTHVIAQSISFDLSKGQPLSVNVSATGSNWTEVFILDTPALSKQNSAHFIHGSLEIAGQNNLAGLTFEITKDISWLNDKSVHDALSGIYLPRRAIIEDLAIFGSITNYKRTPSLTQLRGVPLQFVYADSIVFNLDKVKFLDRWEVSEVHRIITDFKALPTSNNIYIEF